MLICRGLAATSLDIESSLAGNPACKEKNMEVSY
jgi:hypothetical protein